MTGFSLYKNFLAMHGIVGGDLLPPISERLLIYFVAFCHSVRNLKHGTIKLYLCGVRFAFISQGGPNPLVDCAGATYSGLATVLRAVKRVAAPICKPRLPITFTVLRNLVNVLRRGVYSPFTDALLEAACVTAFFGFLRCGEFTVRTSFCSNSNLIVGHVVFDASSTSACITLQASKTDPFRQGVKIQLFCTGGTTCPVHALATYARLRTGATTDPAEPFFVEEGGSALTRSFFITKLKELLQRIGLDPALYNGNSFRIGAATTAANAQVEDHLIQTLGRWASNCYSRYIRTEPSTLCRAQRQMCFF